MHSVRHAFSSVTEKPCKPMNVEFMAWKFSAFLWNFTFLKKVFEIVLEIDVNTLENYSLILLESVRDWCKYVEKSLPDCQKEAIVFWELDTAWCKKSVLSSEKSQILSVFLQNNIFTQKSHTFKNISFKESSYFDN